MLRNVHTESLGSALIIWYDLSNGKGAGDLLGVCIGQGIRKIEIRLSECAGGWVGQRGRSKSRGFFFSMEKETKIINWEQDFLYAKE